MVREVTGRIEAAGGGYADHGAGPGTGGEESSCVYGNADTIGGGSSNKTVRQSWNRRVSGSQRSKSLRMGIFGRACGRSRRNKRRKGTRLRWWI